MQTSVVQQVEIPASRTSAEPGRSDFLIGLALTALVPAIFWIVLFAGLARSIGYTPDLGALLAAGSAIAAFLGAFFAILSSKPSRAP